MGIDLIYCICLSVAQMLIAESHAVNPPRVGGNTGRPHRMQVHGLGIPLAGYRSGRDQHRGDDGSLPVRGWHTRQKRCGTRGEMLPPSGPAYYIPYRMVVIAKLIIMDPPAGRPPGPLVARSLSRGKERTARVVA
jgi:hypothetical protein